jgi:hypothetical protein
MIFSIFFNALFKRRKLNHRRLAAWIATAAPTANGWVDKA